MGYPLIADTPERKNIFFRVLCAYQDDANIVKTLKNGVDFEKLKLNTNILDVDLTNTKIYAIMHY